MTLSKAELQAEASLSAEQMDAQSKLSAPNSQYSKRLAKLTRELTSIDGTPLNFAVYESDEINAFAMPDGTVRVYSGLMDVMDDAELVAVIGHEIGHVKFDHSLNQFKTAYLTEAAKQAAVAAGGTVGSLASSQYGDIGAKFVSAQFSQQDELESDAYGVEVLCQLGMDPYAAARAQQNCRSTPVTAADCSPAIRLPTPASKRRKPRRPTRPAAAETSLPVVDHAGLGPAFLCSAGR
ncbi:M48 family metalloprotease [Oceanimonas sp. NS1]|nr:M48 family metalloprotease [Oceanimonas sp. NS1]